MLKSHALSMNAPDQVPFGTGLGARAIPDLSAADADEARLLSVAESIGNMGHWHWYPETDAMIWSDQLWPMVGRDPSHHLASLDLALECTHPDDRAKVQRELRYAATEGTGFEFDARIVRPDGEVRTVIAKGLPEFRDGRVESMFGVLTDVTEAFATIRATREQHEMLDLAAELAQLGHWVWNCEEQAMSFGSDELARIHGLPIEIFRARFQRPEDFAAVIVTEHRDMYLRAIRGALTKAEPYAIEYRLVTPTGHAKDLREIGHPLFDEDAGLKRFIGTVQDITETKRRENELQVAKAQVEMQAEALRRSELKFRDIVEGSIQGIVILRDFRPVFANQAYAAMLGLDGPDDVIALGDLRRLMAPDGVAEGFWSEAAKGELGAKSRRVGIRTVHGQNIWTDAIVRAIEWEGESAFLVTVVDVTERHIGEQELQAKTKELQELNLQKDKLFSIISHDLKGPFNAVIGFADMLAARAATLTADKIADYARIVRDSAISVHGLFDNLLTWSAFQLRDAAPRFAPVALSAAVGESVEPLLSMASEKDVHIVNAVDETAPDVYVLADEDLLHIVLRNLVSNGIKFCHAGGEVRVTAVVDSTVKITIRDTGVGMAAGEVANLFQLDRAVSAPGTRGERGTGLGLYLCRDIVMRHGGEICAESVAGKGSAFHITLPLASRPKRSGLRPRIARRADRSSS
jgi:PAS domain S-box-containing protein